MNNWNAYAMQGPQWAGGWGQVEAGPTGGPLGYMGQGGYGRQTGMGVGYEPSVANQKAMQQLTYGNYMPGQGAPSMGMPQRAGGYDVNPAQGPLGLGPTHHGYTGGDPQLGGVGAGMGHQVFTGGVLPPQGGGYPMQTGGNDPAQVQHENFSPDTQRGAYRPQMNHLNGWGQFMQHRQLVN